MIILDTSVVVSALDRDDRRHAECRSLLESTDESLVLPAPAVTEIDYLVTRNRGATAAVEFLRDIRRGAYAIEDLALADYGRAAELMERYADLLVGFVDASILAIVERLEEPKLATLDHRHFSAMRPRHVDSLELLPK